MSPILCREEVISRLHRERFNKALLDYKDNPTKSWKNISLAPKGYEWKDDANYQRESYSIILWKRNSSKAV